LSSPVQSVAAEMTCNASSGTINPAQSVRKAHCRKTSRLSYKSYLLRWLLLMRHKWRFLDWLTRRNLGYVCNATSA